MSRVKGIDFFCGFGGATFGLTMSEKVKIVAAVNHDPDAIACHEQNHPDVDHYNRDIREVDADDLAKKYPDVGFFWWSAECTHFSNAKGGGPRDADSRMLNMELPRFAKPMKNLDRIFYENVREFLTWGPLDDQGKPIKSRKGEYFHRWVKVMENLGYRHDYRIVDVADYGARTSRVRMFGVFVKDGIQISWPRQTHAKNPEPASLLNPNPLKKWLPVKPLLDLDNWGDSIFTREEKGKKPLVKATIARIEYGLNKYGPDNNGVPYVLQVADSEDMKALSSSAQTDEGMITKHFFMKYYSGKNNVGSVDKPLGTITTMDGYAMVTAQYIVKQWSGEKNVQSVNDPMHTITTVPCGNMITPFVLPYNFGNRPQDIESPLGTIMAKRDKYIVIPFVVPTSYSNRPSSIDAPCPTILASRRHHSVSFVQFIEKQYRGKKSVASIEDPLGTITTVPKLRLVSGIFVDCRIVDVYMRMLTVQELLPAQGFPADYKVPKSSTKAKKFIGNSVPPHFCELLTHSQFGDAQKRIEGIKEYIQTA